jgi:PTH1 family peptidyl-tRNA hydrolase
MNLSGAAVRHAMDYYKIVDSELLVVCDDINLPFGRLRFRAEGSDGGHNGLASIIAHLDSQQFCRLRIGVSREFEKGAQADYVLSPFGAAEREDLGNLIDRAADAVLHFSEHGLTSAMNRYNN